MTTCRSLNLSPGTTAFAISTPGFIPRHPADRAAAEEEQRRGLERMASDLAAKQLIQAGLRQQDACKTCRARILDQLGTIESTTSGQLVETALKLAEMILRHRLPDREMIEGLVRETLNPITDLRGVRIRMSRASARMFSGDENSGGGLPCAAEIVPDATLSDMDLVIECGSGVFDARLDQRIALLRDKLTERMTNGKRVA